jgi:hypothetical protein
VALSLAVAGCSSILGLALLHDASATMAAAAINMYFFIFLVLFFVIMLFRFSLFRFLIDGKSALASHLAVLVHHAVNASFPHGLAVVDMLRTEAPVFTKNQFYAEKSHADSNY